jgi:hypothetical protein
MSSRPRELLGVFVIQEVKSVANCKDSFGVTARVIQQILVGITFFGGYAVTQVEALRYKAGGRGYDSPYGRWDFFNWLNPFGHNMALGLTQPLREMRTRLTS